MADAQERQVMSDDTLPNPLKNFTPRANPPKQSQFAGDIHPIIDIDDKDALRELTLKTLVEIIQSSPKSTALVPALKELMDRIDGKAAQSIAMTVKDVGLDKVSTDKLIRLAAMLDDPIVILPIPSKLLDN